MRSIIVVVVCLFFTLTLKGQDLGYHSEFIWGIKKSTTGGIISGFVFKKGIVTKNKMLTTFGVEIVNVKSPYEARYTSQTGESFIWDKQNYLYSIRLQYGRDIVLFYKAPQQGVQVSGVFAAGLSIGIQAPYYVKYNAGGIILSAQYNPDVQNFSNILGTGYLFEGLGQSKVVPGINLKAGLSFEFGSFKNNISGVEVGAFLEAFPKEILIMPFTPNKAVFPSVYITLIYGSRK